jgi:DNA-binding Lrp family transcriptional regulator
MKLISLVCEKNLRFSEASRILRISPSTAKMIIKKYQNEGKIFEKK